MKSFIEWMNENKKIPLVQTCFGQHSLSSKERRLKESAKEDDDIVHHFNKYSEHDKKAIKSYTNTSLGLNKNLHEVASGKEKTHNDSAQIKDMDDVVNRHRTDKDMIVHSGLRHSPEGKKTISHPAYLSTSTSKDAAVGFAHSDKKSKLKHPDAKGKEPGHLLSLEVPSGHAAAYVAHHSLCPREKEMILPRNTTMHKTKEPEYDKFNNVWTHHYKVHSA